MVESSASRSEPSSAATQTEEGAQTQGQDGAPAAPSGPKPWTKNPFVWAAIIGAITIPLLRPLTRRIPPPPPVLGTLPAFKLIDHHGKPFGRKQMLGTVHVVKFFFTRCPSICPKMMKAMRRLQKGFAYHQLPVRLLSITVDPEHDTPAKLRAYAKKYKVDLKNWIFLTGKEADVLALSQKGFRVAASNPKQKKSLMEISHSGKLILVDQKARIRGYYSTSKRGLDEAFHRTKRVLRQAFEESRKR